MLDRKIVEKVKSGECDPSFLNVLQVPLYLSLARSLSCSLALSLSLSHALSLSRARAFSTVKRGEFVS